MKGAKKLLSRIFCKMKNLKFWGNYIFERWNFPKFSRFSSLAVHCSETVTPAGVIFYMLVATSMGHHVAWAVKLSEVRHVPRGHVFESRTSQIIVCLPICGLIARKQHKPGTLKWCNQWGDKSCLHHRWSRGTRANLGTSVAEIFYSEIFKCT